MTTATHSDIVDSTNHERNPMYVIKKCDDHGYGRNKWVVVHTTPDREDAISWVREEYRMLLSCDPRLTSEDIDDRLNKYYGCPKTGQASVDYGRHTFGHGNVRFSIMQSDSVEYQPAGARPDRTALLDSILS